MLRLIVRVFGVAPGFKRDWPLNGAGKVGPVTAKAFAPGLEVKPAWKVGEPTSGDLFSSGVVWPRINWEDSNVYVKVWAASPDMERAIARTLRNVLPTIKGFGIDRSLPSRTAEVKLNEG